jgi:DNA-binding winged helix-turn-helix (wHTH) protein/TolB-like protein/Flp pilus assembly protein TadD
MAEMQKRAYRLYSFDGFTLNLTSGCLLKEGREVKLRPKSFKVLEYLVENCGRLVSKEELIQAVWPDSFVTDNSLVKCLKEVRLALGDDSQRIIKTMPRRGYIFVAEVRENEPDSTAFYEEQVEGFRVVIQEEQQRDEKAQGASKQALAALTARRGLRANRAVIISALLLVALTATLFYFVITNKSDEPHSLAQIKSIAVLPFKPLVSGSRNEPLELGLADSLIAKLSKIKELTVRPTSAILKYSDDEQDPVAIGQALKVDAVLESRIQQVGDRVRINSQLVSVKDGKPIWSFQCNQECADLFAAQDSISEDIVRALALNLNSEERESLKKRYTESGEAYRFYLLGRFYWNKRTEEGMEKALQYFGQAIQADAGYALAYAGMADCYFTISLPPKERWTEAKAAAVKALELDNTLAEAHTSLAYARMNYDWNWPGAESEFKRAIELNPNYATARHWYGEYLSAMGRHNDGIAETKRAVELEPTSLIINANLGRLLYYARLYDLAIKQLQETVAMDESFARTHRNLGWVYEQKGMSEEAVREFEKAITLSGGAAETVSSLGHAYASSGEKTKAYQIINRLKQQSKQQYISPFNIAIIYAGLGEKDRAFKWLEHAYADRSLWMVFLEVDPRLDSLRSDPRFADLVRRVGLSH